MINDVCNPAKNKSEQQNAEEGKDNAALAAYIANMSGELAALAGRAQLPMLAYFLNLARAEAADSRERTRQQKRT